MNQLRSSYLLIGALLLLGDASPSLAQGFSSGSNESDGALNIAGGLGTVVFDPTTLNIDGDGDRVFHFSTISVGTGTTLTFPASTLGEGRPIVWLATGAVTISGVLELSGQAGHHATAPALPADAGAGGFAGGVGANFAMSTPPRGGSGPGGGASGAGLHGGGAGHAHPGNVALSLGAAGGASYGNVFLLPCLGGSGGGGGGLNNTNGSGGGGGGGAIVIASSASIQVTGSILARGGAPGAAVGGSGARQGGGGSGGAIRLIAPTLSGNGTLNVQVLGSGTNVGANGRIRLESFQQGFNGSYLPNSSFVTFAGPGLVFLPPTAPQVRVTAVDGVTVAASPTGSFVTPDVVVDSATPVSIDIAASNIPPGTQVRITLIPENGESVTLTSTVLTGTLASSTATAGPVTLPHGFTRFFVAATWTP